MNILLHDFGSYMNNDMFTALKRLGHHVKNTFYAIREHDDKYYNPKTEEIIEKELEHNEYDCVITTNILPVAARICYEKNIPYLAWSFDSPIEVITDEYASFPTNHFFLYDRLETEYYQKKGFDCFHHLSLAVNCERLDHIKNDNKKYICDISLVGKLYESPLRGLTASLNDYLTGYLDGMIAMQRDIYGAYLIDELLTDELIHSINCSYGAKEKGEPLITKPQLSYLIATYITRLDRITLLKILADRYDTALFTYPLNKDEQAVLRGVRIEKPVSYLREMPKVFKASRVNLHPPLKSIKSGISLRVLDVLGCRGFLLASYLPEIAERFIPDKEVVLYESIEDACEKAAFFLKHKELRESIARAGYEKVKKEFRFEDRFVMMFRIAGLQT